MLLDKRCGECVEESRLSHDKQRDMLNGKVLRACVTAGVPVWS